MRSAILVALFLTLSASYASRIENLCDLPEKLAKECLQIEQPVCGISYNNKGVQVRTDYLNRCLACKVKQTQFVALGACASYPQEGVFCHPIESTAEFCPDQEEPTCALFDETIKCIRYPCGFDAYNPCAACQSPAVVFRTYKQCNQL